LLEERASYVLVIRAGPPAYCTLCIRGAQLGFCE
jgi:hypothetical protein